MVCCESYGQIRHDSAKPSPEFAVAQAGDPCEKSGATRHGPLECADQRAQCGLDGLRHAAGGNIRRIALFSTCLRPSTRVLVSHRRRTE